jgi:hypothetical protein
MLGEWSDHGTTFLTWSPDTAQLVIAGLEFWRYPPLQGEKRAGYVVCDGHWQDSTWVNDRVVFKSFPDSVAVAVSVNAIAHWHEFVPHWTDNAESTYLMPGIVGSVTVSVSGGLWGAQSASRPVQAFKQGELP